MLLLRSSNYALRPLAKIGAAALRYTWPGRRWKIEERNVRTPTTPTRRDTRVHGDENERPSMQEEGKQENKRQEHEPKPVGKSTALRSQLLLFTTAVCGLRRLYVSGRLLFGWDLRLHRLAWHGRCCVGTPLVLAAACCPLIRPRHPSRLPPRSTPRS